MSGILAIVFLIIIGWATTNVLGKMGFSRWWALLILFAPLFVIGIWVAAFRRWPAGDGAIPAAGDGAALGDDRRAGMR